MSVPEGYALSDEVQFFYLPDLHVPAFLITSITSSCNLRYAGCYSRANHVTEDCHPAGRGFFHINSHGGAEPCPFLPYSDVNVKDSSLTDAIRSELFTSLRDVHVLEGDHTGGCVFFEKKEQVEQLAGASTAQTATPLTILPM